MAKDKPAAEAPAAEPAADTVDEAVAVITSDEFAGHGGSYTYDPVTKTRTLNKEP